MDQEQAPDLVETETETGVVREGTLPDGSLVRIEIVTQPEEL